MYGKWAIPVFPNNRSLAGSIPTPYIFDDRCTPEDAADAIEVMYNYSKEEREMRGLAGYKWVTGDEANMTADKMSIRFMEVIDKAFEKFTPRTSFDFHTIEDRPAKYIEHKLTGY
jgi:hypothetical protein